MSDRTRSFNISIEATVTVRPYEDSARPVLPNNEDIVQAFREYCCNELLTGKELAEEGLLDVFVGIDINAVEVEVAS